MLQSLSLKDINQMSNSLFELSQKDPYLKAKIDTLNIFEIYELKYKATNQRSTNVSVIGFNKKTGEVVQFDPKGQYSPVIMFKTKNKEQFVRFLDEQQRKGMDIKRLK